MSGGFEKWCFCLWTEQNASGFKIRIAVIHFREVIFKIDEGGRLSWTIVATEPVFVKFVKDEGHCIFLEYLCH